MKSLSFNDTELYHLRCLSQTVYEATGVWHELADPNSVMKLMRFSSAAPIESVFAYFCSLVAVLDEEHCNYFQRRGILIPFELQSVLVDEVEEKKLVG